MYTVYLYLYIYTHILKLSRGFKFQTYFGLTTKTEKQSIWPYGTQVFWPNWNNCLDESWAKTKIMGLSDLLAPFVVIVLCVIMFVFQAINGYIRCCFITTLFWIKASVRIIMQHVWILMLFPCFLGGLGCMFHPFLQIDWGEPLLKTTLILFNDGGRDNGWKSWASELLCWNAKSYYI